MDTCRRLLGQRWTLSVAVLMLLVAFVWWRFAPSPSPDRALPTLRIAQAIGGEGEGRAPGSVASTPAKPQGAGPEPPQAVQGDAAQGECPPEEHAALSQAVPRYVHWHWMRHAQWHEDEVIDAVLEALAKEEEGDEGATKGRGPTFRLMLAVLEAAGPAKAALVQSGVPASVVLDTLRTGAAGRTREVSKLAIQFASALTCLRTHHPAMAYLTTLNQMPHFPDPIVDPPGEIGPFIGAYMRKHVIVDHDVITQSILIAALSAHKTLKPLAKRAASKAASLGLIEQALARLDPKIGAAARQEQGDKALTDFLAGRAALKQRQAKALQEYGEVYQRLAPDAQGALIAFAPPPAPERAPTRPQPTPPPAPELRGAVAGTAHPPAPSRKAPAAPGDTMPPDKRIALVIGNGGYKEAPLVNPLNDAKAMGSLLSSLGFEVIAHENLAKRAMEDAIRAFGKRLRAGGVGLFYFAGHGVQVNGANYLLPIGSAIEKEQDVEYDAVEAGRVMREMEAAENRVNIVILDACRNNPFTRSFRTATRGLVAMNASSGLMIAYATAPGTVASDGNGPHGLYTQELLQHMRLPGVKLEEMFKRVRVAVKAKSQGKQLPWEASALEEDFYFVKP